MAPGDRFRTHEVDNQPPSLPAHDAFTLDAALRDAVVAFGGGWGADRLQAYGRLTGGDLRDIGNLANRFPPHLLTHDGGGHRIDRVEFHPAYHEAMSIAIGHGLHALPWQHPGPGTHVVRAGLVYLHHQVEAGSNCPLTMTYASMPVLRQLADGADWCVRVTGSRYDPRPVAARDKSTITLGMGMTEKQGGSDVRSNRTRAALQSDGSYRLVGHKWFLSAPMSDGFLVLAQAGAGLTCFLLPRLRDDGSDNGLRLQRLKDKLGNRANASSEVEFHDAQAWRIGDEGRGVATIIDMVALTRLDCMVGSAALMRQALVQAVHHCRHRRAFGRVLAQQPLMRNVLADLALESEAAMWLALRASAAVDRAGSDAGEAALARILTPIGKYWICRRAPAIVNEAQECLGGAGYVEESILPRLYREAPLNSIWEGSGNLQCLDVLRALQRDPASRAALREALLRGRGADPVLDLAVDEALQSLNEPAQVDARRLVERLALVLQGTLLLRHAPAAVSGAFLQSRLAGDHGLALGTLPAGVDHAGLVLRAWPD